MLGDEVVFPLNQDFIMFHADAGNRDPTDNPNRNRNRIKSESGKESI